MSEKPPLQPADPNADFLLHEKSIRSAIDRVLQSGHYILGPEVDAFEREFAEYLGGGHVIGVANGTDALELALRAAGVRPGDLVATVANTVSATVAAIQQAGARPVFVEIDAATMLMSPEQLDRTLSLHGTRIRAVVPVHLYGNPADMHRIAAVCDSHHAAIVEDCAQAHGATIDGQRAGTFSRLSTFSFYPTKNLGALGDGGGVFTRDPELADEVRLLRQYGWRTRYISEIAGRNSRLDELQAAILRAKLPSLDESNEARSRIAARYSARLADSSLVLPQVTAGAVAVWHQYAIRTEKRDDLRATLLDAGIACGILYPVPIHHQPAYLDRSTRLPVTEKACDEVLCLPCHPGLGLEDVDRVCEVILQ
ncbi:MAG: DegT/DnrJ/EryC1/StrS family aminotransferase [Blastocatellia bacterium]|nr:DegT/DnrJ/EryC1/StrS family aminotransferase [Blastocatellia bacterium]